MAIICVDAGTTMIKAIGYDEDGKESLVARQTTSVTRPAPGWAEQDMAAVWDAVVLTVRQVADQLPGAVDFVAFTAQGDGSWLVDSSGVPTGPAVLWNDGRAAQIIDEWTRAGVLDQAFRINGSLTSGGLPNAILTWFRRHDPARLERSATSLTCAGWLFTQLTGEVCTDESDASAPFLDIRNRRYSPELLDLYDMAWARDLLPEIRGDERRVAEMSASAAASLGLPTGTPVVMSSYDTVHGGGERHGRPRRPSSGAQHRARRTRKVPACVSDAGGDRGDPVGLSHARSHRARRAE
jgi:xylulokinase